MLSTLDSNKEMKLVPAISHHDCTELYMALEKE